MTAVAKSAGEPPGARGRRPDPRDGRFWCAGDLAVIAKLMPAALVAWLVPVGSWDRLATAAVGSGGKRSVNAEATMLRRRLEANLIVEQLQFLSSYRSDGGPGAAGRRPRSSAASAGGRARRRTVADAAGLRAPGHQASLAEAGVAVHHLSRQGHGFSPTWLGQRLLNPFRTRVERRYLAERIVLPLAGMSPASSRHVLGLLDANKVVSITLGGNGTQAIVVQRPLGRFRIATGAPNLALRHGAALLPVWTARTAPGRFVTVIEEPLTAAAGASRGDRLDALALAMLDRLEAQALRWPDRSTQAPCSRRRRCRPA